MPELPEVETIRRGLEECLTRKRSGRVLSVEILETKSFIGEPEEIISADVIAMRRRGKALIFDLSNGKSLICHLRMTGQMIWSNGKERFAGGHPNDNFIAELPNKQTRVVIDFENGRLFFNDQRKFGFMKVVPTNGVEKDAFIRKLAKEPWEMSGEEIKSVILDQTIIAGLGNIYADEALHYAMVNPKRKAGLVSKEDAEKIIAGARTVMEKSLDAGGSTIRNYVKSDGTRGDYLELFAEVFNRQGKECRRCGEKIVKTKVGGRGTHYCPRCQKT